MTPEEIARRFSKRPGFELVSYRQVALPLFRMSVCMLTIARRELPPFQEFVLKTVDAGLRAETEIAGLLGVDPALARNAIVDLAQSNCVVLFPAPAGSESLVALTDRGERALSRAEIDVPERVNVAWYVDGLTRRLVFPEDNEVICQSELKGSDLLEIAPYPRDAPSARELMIQLSKYLSEHGLPADRRPRELLAIIGIDWSERRFWSDALALVYKSIDGAEVQVGFALNGVLSELHEFAFLDADRRSLVPLMPTAREDPTPAFEEILDAEFLRTAGIHMHARSGSDVTQPDTSLTPDKLEPSRITDSAGGGLGNHEYATLQDSPEPGSRVGTRDVRVLGVYDHGELLHRAMTTARDRIMIISPWIRANVVNHAFVSAIRAALERRVQVYVGYGFGPDDDAKTLGRDRDAANRLRDLSSHTGFHMAKLGDVHAKVLICDREFVIVTSFNWLSFEGSRQREFRDERGVYVGIPSQVDEVFRSYASRFPTDDAM